MKSLILTLELLFVSINLFSQENNSLLWKISGNGIEQPSYLYGTIHLICPEDYQLGDSVLKAVQGSQQLFLEIDMDDPEMNSKMMNVMMLEGDVTIQSLTNEEDYRKIDEYLKANIGVGISAFNKMKPLTFISMATMGLLKCQPVSYETEFVKLATSQGVEVVGLETLEYQMGIFDSIPYDLQLDVFIDMIERETEAVQEFDELIELYKKQDIENLYKILKQSEWGFKGFEELVVDVRNENWIPVIEKEIMIKPTFFAFGAGHLAGNNGVISLLKNKGYVIEPVVY